ncbi:HNH endonuclease signature motif containing protein, partial [Oryzobacter sp. R7]|uniref:HNH endonuclease signature motif containing protein n=1 Tax=Oryzobacter faecalis TaxID=3388656 RepID=UPI00398CEA95
ALTDLVTAQATVTISLVLTTPADTTDTTDTTVSAAPGSEGTRTEATCPAAASTRRGGDLVEVRGMRPGEPALVPRAWVEQLLTATTGTGGRTARRAWGRTGPPAPPGPPGRPGRPPDREVGAGFEVSVSTVPCHPETGALQPDPAIPDVLGYRPPPWLAALVKARDGRCRFPGCSVAARSCDLDHVRPWPAGPTAADNLAALCRRHHRIKQRPGWTARMMPGAVLEWTDPTGRVTPTHPQDALHGAVLPAPDPANDPDGPTNTPGEPADLGDTRCGVQLEHLLQRLPGATVWTRACPRDRRLSVVHARLAGRDEAGTETTARHVDGPSCPAGPPPSWRGAEPHADRVGVPPF